MLVEQRAIVSSAVRHVCGVYGYESVWVVDIMIFDVIIPEQYVCMSELCGGTPMLYHKIAGQR